MKKIIVGTLAVLGLFFFGYFCHGRKVGYADGLTRQPISTARQGAEFAACVTEGTGGELEIVTHPGGSLFSGSDIKRAIQTGQTQIGERLLSAHQNENALFGFDSIPFLATSFEDAVALWEVAKPELAALLDSQNLHLLYSVPWPPQGLYFKKEVNSVADMAGIKFRSYNTATAKIAELAGMIPVQI